MELPVLNRLVKTQSNDIYLCVCVCVSAGNQDLIHNLLLDSEIMFQLATRVWKSKDLNT